MPQLEILTHPDPRLRQIAKPVSQVDKRIQQLVDDMFETMHKALGIGLAATQVNIHKRVVVIDVSDNKDDPRVFINPEITELHGEEEMKEGCLSVPGFQEVVKRAESIRVTALDKDGQSFELETGGLLAVCVQHEIDHLNGKLFTDYLSKLKQRRIRKKLEKIEKER